MTIEKEFDFDIDILQDAPVTVEQPMRPPAASQAQTGAGFPVTLIEQAIASSNFDMVDRMASLQREWEDRQAKRDFLDAMALFQKEVPEIPKKDAVNFENKDGTRTAYKYASIGTILEHIKDPLCRNGLSVTYRFDSGEGVYSCEAIVSHRSGYSKSTTLRSTLDQSGNKNSIQQIGSTNTFLMRYTLIGALGLASVDVDDDGAAGFLETGGHEEPQIITSEDAKELCGRLEAAGADISAFCKYLSIPSIEEMPQYKWPKAMAALRAKEAAASKQ